VTRVYKCSIFGHVRLNCSTLVTHARSLTFLLNPRLSSLFFVRLPYSSCSQKHASQVVVWWS